MAVNYLESFIKGRDRVLSNLNKEIAKIEGNITEKGMWKSILLVEREAKIETPVRTGNLINSYSREVRKEHEQIIGEIKNNAAYALIVHETPAHYRKPGSKWKFLEDPLKKNSQRILDILANSARK